MLAESVNFIMKITKKNVSVDVEVAVINGKNVFILKAGSTIELPKPSLKGAIKTRRQIASDTENVTAIDLSCSSLSLLASIITGTQTNGNKYFQNTALSAYCVVPTATATANTAPVVTEEKEEEETPAEPVKSEEPVKETPKAEEKPAVVLTKAEIKARKDLSVKLENFVQDFGYEIDPRMKDTLSYQAPADMENYIKNCAKLIGIDDSLINFGSEKFKSPEWDEMKGNQRISKSNGGNWIPDSVKDIYARLNMTGEEKNIVLFDGQAGYPEQFRSLKCFDNRNTTFIIEESNTEYIKKNCRNSIIIEENFDYAGTLFKNIEKAFDQLF